jgi:uncharacterized membrane protein
VIDLSNNTLESIIGVELQWWGGVIGLSITLLILIILGMATTHIKYIKKFKTMIENKIIDRIPFVKNIYSFGNEIVDTFVTDIKDDGDFTVVEVDFGGFKALGVLTDKKNSIGFVISAPSPLTGVVLKLPNYTILDISFMDAVKINTSLGRINGDKWE